MRAAQSAPALLGLALTCLSAAVTHAQSPPGVPYVEDVVAQGDRVRVVSDGTSGEFLIADVRSGALSLRGEPSIELPIVSLSGLQVWRGRDISLLEGLSGGAAVGGLVGTAVGLQGSQPHYTSLTGLSLKGNILSGMGLGLLLGLFVHRSSDEVWQDVALPHRPMERPRADPTFQDGPTLTVVGDIGSDDLVELTVRNRTPEPMDAFAWWEGAARVSLGVVRANSTSTFVTARRSPSLVLFVSPLASPGLPRGPAPRPSEFIVVGPGEQLEWVISASDSGIVEEYVRRTLR